jgi:hypothetical protein
MKLFWLIAQTIGVFTGTFLLTYLTYSLIVLPSKLEAEKKSIGTPTPTPTPNPTAIPSPVPPVPNSSPIPIYKGSHRSSDSETHIWLEISQMRITVTFLPSNNGKFSELSDVCIFEVLRRTNGTAPSNPDDPSSPAAQNPADLPEPFKDQPNPDIWLKQYHTLTGVNLPKKIDGIKIEGSLVATWGVDGNNCKTNSKKKETGGFYTSENHMYFIDSHGTVPVTPPTPGKPYKIGGGFNVRQYYLWYRIGKEDEVHIFAGPFFIRRWVWGTRQTTDLLQCRFWGTGDVVYYMNVAKYDHGGSLISEKLINPILGCGGLIEKVSP